MTKIENLSQFDFYYDDMYYRGSISNDDVANVKFEDLENDIIKLLQKIFA